MEDNTLLPRLEAIRARYEEVEKLISDPSVISDMTRFKRLNKEYKDLQEHAIGKFSTIYVRLMN